MPDVQTHPVRQLLAADRVPPLSTAPSAPWKPVLIFSGARRFLIAVIVAATSAALVSYLLERGGALQQTSGGLPGPRIESHAAEADRRDPDGLETRRDELRVCADPNNMPFSNRQGAGFENELAHLIARDLGWKVSFTWWPQRRGFVRNTLRAGKCDVIMGVPAGYDLVETTHPYYRSSYVFVTRSEDDLRIESFDDPRLRQITIGVQALGDDYANVPPAQMLAMRGIVNNLRGYSIYGDYSAPDPTRALIEAVSRAEVDVSIAWGPMAGYFAHLENVSLDVRPIPWAAGLQALPMQFDIAIGVRRGERELTAKLNGVLADRRAEIAALLERYHVPIVEGP